ncbi:hypothetical protein Cgig2_028523 [Carnegiea gigantea]|uniref:Uncharacterized protein n=1 Tax=Carnegiea gigantea TaxID=171969 RepID=A0A9Q1GUG3_9CARY|nr:hypothetical protein Cgig2_028523 [Carnegiea gigantea]
MGHLNQRGQEAGEGVCKDALSGQNHHCGAYKNDQNHCRNLCCQVATPVPPNPTVSRSNKNTRVKEMGHRSRRIMTGRTSMKLEMEAKRQKRRKTYDREDRILCNDGERDEMRCLIEGKMGEDSSGMEYEPHNKGEGASDSELSLESEFSLDEGSTFPSCALALCTMSSMTLHMNGDKMKRDVVHVDAGVGNWA